MNWPWSKPKQPRRTLQASALFAALRSQFDTECTIRLADGSYVSLSEQEAFQFVRNSSTFWHVEDNDCDDQAWMAKAEAIKRQQKADFSGPAAFGVVWTEDHALNWFMNHEGTIQLIDQPGRIVTARQLSPITLILA